MAKSYYSTVFDAPAAKVWAIARDFNGLATWFGGAVSVSEIEAGKSGEAVSGVRNFLFGDTRIREQLVGLSDMDCSYTYVFCDPAPFPVKNYLATLRVTPITDGNRSFAEWSAEFDCDEGRERELTELIGNGVFQTGFDALKRHFSRR